MADTIQGDNSIWLCQSFITAEQHLVFKLLVWKTWGSILGLSCFHITSRSGRWIWDNHSRGEQPAWLLGSHGRSLLGRQYRSLSSVFQVNATLTGMFTVTPQRNQEGSCKRKPRIMQIFTKRKVTPLQVCKQKCQSILNITVRFS